jgi:predicted pyridoxine 5'-phosphate oxidase superfamily flavin-nucleotide-binding protein
MMKNSGAIDIETFQRRQELRSLRRSQLRALRNVNNLQDVLMFQVQVKALQSEDAQLAPGQALRRGRASAAVQSQSQQQKRLVAQARALRRAAKLEAKSILASEDRAQTNEIIRVN